MNPRIRLIPFHELPEVNGASVKSPTGYNLELRDVRVTDAGDYACQIGTLEPQEIIHKLEVLVPPKIDFISPGGGRLDVAKGSPIRLECRGSGNPTPKIYWSRKVKKTFFIHFSTSVTKWLRGKTFFHVHCSSYSQNNLMPNGEANVTGNVFEILHADRHSAGHYRCSADNRVGAADTRDIFVNVLCKFFSDFIKHDSVIIEYKSTADLHARSHPIKNTKKTINNKKKSFEMIYSLTRNRSWTRIYPHWCWLWSAINVSRALRTSGKHCLVQRHDPIRNHGAAFSTGNKANI